MESTSRTRYPGPRKEVGVGCWIWWNGLDRARGGPAQVWMLVLSHQRQWAYVEFEGNGVWVREDLITEVVQGSGRPTRAIEPPHGHWAPTPPSPFLPSASGPMSRLHHADNRLIFKWFYILVILHLD